MHLSVTLGIIAVLAALAITLIARRARRRREDWTRHPPYLADAGGLFGAAPRLKCRGRNCGKATHELFYGHCRPCAERKGIPIQVASPEEFRKALDRGTTAVISGKC